MHHFFFIRKLEKVLLVSLADKWQSFSLEKKTENGTPKVKIAEYRCSSFSSKYLPSLQSLQKKEEKCVSLLVKSAAILCWTQQEEINDLLLPPRSFSHIATWTRVYRIHRFICTVDIFLKALFVEDANHKDILKLQNKSSHLVIGYI